jgi:transposase-like protein
MSTGSKVQSSESTRIPRYFSESFRQSKVKEIDRNLTTVAAVCRDYEVSRSAVYKWIYKYSLYRKRQIRQIIEPMSDTQKIKELQAKIKELERLVGQKQIQLEFKDKMIEIAEEMYRVDIKKKLGSKLSGGLANTATDTPGA